VIDRIPRADRAAYLKARTYLLAGHRAAGQQSPSATSAARMDVAPAIDARDLAADVANLPPGRMVVESGSMRVYCAPAGELPHVLPEIGRLRELTFRAVGEGTGRSVDLDRFDEHYWHLFAWDPSRAAVVGAYRLGPTDDIVAKHGPAGLYTSTLFRYDSRLLDEIGAALELGRSFVRQEYQREFAPLLLLWKGIGRFIALRPHYRYVFGAVSISNRYESLSRQLLVRFLSGAASHPRAARLVRPRRPLRPISASGSLADVVTVNSLEAVSGLVGAIESDGKAIPVLLRQYLNLNARLLGFSVDAEFGEALDGLMLADLTEVPRAMLQRLMGKASAAEYLAHHAASATADRGMPAKGGWQLTPEGG
jgi:putative hemolysin